jgi:large subunit ribosomal protein L4
MADKEIKNQKSKIKTTDKKSKTVGLKSKQNKKATVKKEVKVVEKKSESKSTAPLFDLSGKKTGTITLPKELFAGKVNEQLMAQAIRVYLTNQRQGTSSTKTRSEVTGSRRKVWRQKGTGRARHGSITGPIFVGGGIVHGPKPRDFELKMPKKMKIQALVSALTEKNKDSKIFVFDGKLTGKSKQFAHMVKNIIGAEKKKNPSVLFIRSKADKQAYLASKNVKKIATVEGTGVNTYEVIKNTAVLISKDAIDEMKQVFVKA